MGRSGTATRRVPLYRELARKGEAERRPGGLKPRPRPTGQQQSTAPTRAPSSAGRLAAARGVQLFLEGAEPDRADHHVAANDVARRAVETERLGELEALLELRFHLVARHVLLDLRHVEADLLGDRQRARLVGLAAAAEQLLVELEIFLAGLVLHARRGGDLRRLHRALAQHGEFLEHELDLAVFEEL